MNWKTLNSVNQLSEIDVLSENKKQVLFKHSTRCSVSSFAKRMLERSFDDAMTEKADFYYLDLIAYREVSNAIAQKYGIYHESPQLLIIENGKCTYNASHNEVSFEAVMD